MDISFGIVDDTCYVHDFYFFNLSNALIVVYLQLFSVTCALFCETDALFWWVNRSQCPIRGNI